MNCYNIPNFLNHFFSTWISYERTYLRSNKGEHNDEKVEEFKMLSEVNKPLLDLDKYRLNELINTLQKIPMTLLLIFIKQIWIIHSRLYH
jgi:hypothetical protein